MTQIKDLGTKPVVDASQLGGAPAKSTGEAASRGGPSLLPADRLDAGPTHLPEESSFKLSEGLRPPECSAASRLDGAGFGYLRRSREALLSRATRVEVGPSDSWADVAKKLYGEQLTPETARFIGEVTAFSNARPAQEPPSGVVDVPDLKDLGIFLRGLRSRYGDRLGKPSEAGEVTRRNFGGRDLTPTALPSAGHAYETRWNDNLRSVVLIAYRDHLKTLSPEELPRAVAGLMLTVAELNGLGRMTLGAAGTIFLPSLEEGQAAMLGSGEELGVSRKLYDRIESSAAAAAEALAELPENPEMGMRYQELGAAIERAGGEVASARVQRAMGSHSFAPWGFSFGLMSEFDEPPAPQDEAIAPMRDGETADDYVKRVAPELPPDERAVAAADLPGFVMEETGFEKPDGTQDDEKIIELLQSLAPLMDYQKVVEARPGESSAAMATRVIMEQVQQKLPIEWDASEDFSVILGRLLEKYPEQAETLSKLGTAHLFLSSRKEASSSGATPPGDGVQLGQAFAEVFYYASRERVRHRDVRRLLADDELLGLPAAPIKNMEIRSSAVSDRERPDTSRDRELSRQKLLELLELENMKAAHAVSRVSNQRIGEAAKEVKEGAEETLQRIARADQAEQKVPSKGRGGPKSWG